MSSSNLYFLKVILATLLGLGLCAVAESRGLSVTVTDDEILEGQRLLAKTTGIFAEPAAAATVEGLKKASAQGLDPEGLTVLLITGNGMKDPEAALQKRALPPAGEAQEGDSTNTTQGDGDDDA